MTPLDEPMDRDARAPTIVAVTAGVAVLAAHAWRFLPFLSDDALISLRYAQRLLDGDGLTWTDGERVEGYSNLLWVLASALLGATGLDLIDTVRILGVLGMGAAVAAVAWAGRGWAGLPAAVLLALCAPMAAWTVGGLEQPLVAGLLAWALVLLLPLADRSPDPPTPRLLAAGALLALLCWTRPDGALLAGCAGLGLILARRDLASVRAACWLGLLPIGAVLLQLGFRLAYYGDWVPNTAYAKVAFTEQRVLGGLRYVRAGLWTVGPLVLASLPAVLFVAQRRQAVLLWTVTVGWLAYVSGIGGDIFPAYRHLVPALVPLGLLAALTFEGLLSRARTVPHVAAVAGIAGLLAGGLVITQEDAPEVRRAHRERWEWDCQVTGLLLRQAFGAQEPVLAAGAAGCLPYFSGLPAIDLYGLNDRFLAHNRPETMGRGRLGHELGDARYVLDREPDFIQFGGPAGTAKGRGGLGLQFERDPRFRRHYKVVGFEGDQPHTFRGLLFVRHHGWG